MTDENTEQKRPQGRQVIHGIRRLEAQYRRAKLDPATVDILRELIEDAAEDEGGVESLNVRQLWLLEDAAFARFINRQIMDFIVRRGSVFAEGKQELHPVLAKSAATWINTSRLNLIAAGLRPERGDAIPTLEQYLRERGSGHAGAAQTDAPGEVRAETSTDTVTCAGGAEGAPERCTGDTEPAT